MKSKKLSVLIYGDFRPDRLASSYRRAFEQLGHEVLPFNTQNDAEHLAPWLRHRIGHRATIRSLRLRRLGARKWNRFFEDTVKRQSPDIVFILNGDFLMPETLRAVREHGTRIFIFHADNPFPGNSAHRPEALPCALECDTYFIWSRHWCQKLRDLGVARAEYLGFAWDEELFPYVAPSPNPQHDVIFIGGWDQEREEALTPLASHCNLKIWGPPYWKSRTRPNSPLRRSWQGKALQGSEVSGVIADSKIVLNELRRQNLPDGVIMRTFEAPGSGGFLLSTRTECATEVFPEQVAGAYFDGTRECISQITYFLQHDDLRREIARKSHDVVRHGHRYVHRAQFIIDTFQGLGRS